MTSQELFRRLYINSKPYEVRSVLWPDCINPVTKATDFTGKSDGFDDSQRQAAANRLIATGHRLDQQIDVWGWDPYTTMLVRLNNADTWVPAAQNGAAIDTPIAGGFSGPPPPDSIKVSLNPDDYPPIKDPAPDAPPPLPPIPKLLNPVGHPIVFSSQPGGIGTLFSERPHDGYGQGDTYTGTAYGFTGTFTKAAKIAGMMICWELTSK